MNPNKAPGPDGFIALFVEKCWDVIKMDLQATLEESRESGSMLRNYNTTNITLILKVKNPRKFLDLRPISLCNIVYRIFTQAIYSRLQKVLKKIVSSEQVGFVPGKETMDGAIVAHEVLHCIHSNQSPTLMIKLDMMKAYDVVQ